MKSSKAVMLGAFLLASSFSFAAEDNQMSATFNPECKYKVTAKTITTRGDVLTQTVNATSIEAGEIQFDVVIDYGVGEKGQPYYGAGVADLGYESFYVGAENKSVALYFEYKDEVEECLDEGSEVGTIEGYDSISGKNLKIVEDCTSN